MPQENKALLVHILEKVDKLEEHVSVVRESQVRTEVSVTHHIKRTDLLEAKVDALAVLIDMLAAPLRLGKWLLKWCGFGK